MSALGYSRERRDLLTEYTNNNKNGTIITLKKSLMKNIKNILNLLNLMNSKKKNMYWEKEKVLILLLILMALGIKINIITT